MLDSLNYPNVGFHFLVRFEGIRQGMASIANANIDSRWTEVTGLGAELGTEELVEGGENRFVHKLPTRAKYSNLVLKRGYFSALPSPIMKWANAAIVNLEIIPCQVQVMLLDEVHKPAQIWNFFNAYPVKISVSDLKATDNSYLIESMELAYQFFKKESLLDSISPSLGI